MTDTKEKTPFESIMEDSVQVQARYQAGRDKIIAHAKSLGADVTEEEVAQLPSLRTYALGDDRALEESEWYERELYAIPEVREAKRRAAMAEEIKAGDGAAHEELMSMRPAQRMEFARANGLTGNGDPEERVSVDTQAERLEILLGMPPAARIAQARKWGLTGE